MAIGDITFLHQLLYGTTYSVCCLQGLYSLHCIKDLESCHYSFANVECLRHSPWCSLPYMIKSFIEAYEVAVQFYFIFSVFSVQFLKLNVWSIVLRVILKPSSSSGNVFGRSGGCIIILSKSLSTNSGSLRLHINDQRTLPTKKILFFLLIPKCCLKYQ